MFFLTYQSFKFLSLSIFIKTIKNDILELNLKSEIKSHIILLLT